MLKTCASHFFCVIYVFIFLYCWNEIEPASAENVVLRTHTLIGSVPVKSWKTLRDQRVVKQDLDYSCGAASLATLLNEFYAQAVTEEQLLDAMEMPQDRASFEDMQRGLAKLGFKGQGFAASYEQLTKLRRPVIVYLKYRTDEHFAVLRGISDDTVWLADPSLGNVTFSREQFLESWQTRGAGDDHAELRGKFLAVLPLDADITPVDDFFTKQPMRQSAPATDQLTVRQRR